MISLKRKTLIKRIGLLSANYTGAWGGIVNNLQGEISKGVTDVPYNEATRIVKDFTQVSAIRHGLMRLINQAYEVGQV